MENITEEELLKEVYDYIRNNYDYEVCDDFGDELQYTLDNGKTINITINIDIEEDE